MSWQHYIYGLRHIARESLRHQLWSAQGYRMGQIGKTDWDTWQRDVNRLTEVPRHG